MDSRLILGGMTREETGRTGREGGGKDGRETAGRTEGLTVRQLVQKLDLDLEEIIACVVCV